MKIMDYESKKMLIVGNMSSGKSTFINSILTENILPTSNLACTAKETKISIKNNQKKYWCYISGNKKSLKKDGLSTLNILNKDKEIEHLEIIGPSILPQLHNVELYDSPGINNSMDIDHESITINMLKNGRFDKIIFLMNAENLFTTDDENTLEKLIEINPQMKDKICVVVNKIDKIALSQESTDDEIKKRVVEFLKKFKIEEKNMEIYVYSSLYFTLNKEKKKTRNEKRALSLLKELYGTREIRNFKMNRKKILS